MRQAALVCLGLFAACASAEEEFDREFLALQEEDGDDKREDKYGKYGPGDISKKQKKVYKKMAKANKKWWKKTFGKAKKNFALVPVGQCEEPIEAMENCFMAPNCCEDGTTCERHSDWFALCRPGTGGGYTPVNTPNPPMYTPNPPRYTPNPPRYTPNPPRRTPEPPTYTPRPPTHHAPCGSHPNALWNPASGSSRSNFLRNELDRFNGRLTPDRKVLAEKYEIMKTSPFKFFRGSSHIFYQDLQNEGVLRRSAFNDMMAICWITGDMHVENIGGFDNNRGDIVLDMNDFDDSWVANYLYDVYRMATSIVFVGEEAGFSACDIDHAVDSFSLSYLETLASYVGNNRETTDFMSRNNARGMMKAFLADTESGNSRKKMLDKWAPVSGSTRKFGGKKAKKLGKVTASERQGLVTAIEAYYKTLDSPLRGKASYFKIVDVARRLKAGTGSLGTNRFYVLIQGEGGVNGNRILDVKQQGYPAVYPTLSAADQSRVTRVFGEMDSGCRASAANKAMINHPDHHIGCVSFLGMAFSVRERSPFKEDFEPEFKKPTDMLDVGKQWGWILAGAHARSDVDFDSRFVKHQLEDAVTERTQGKEAKFLEEVRSFAAKYVRQVNIDYDMFLGLY